MTGVPDRITLTVDGRVYGGWTSAQVTRGLDNLAGAFSLALTVQAAESAIADWRLVAGARARVSVADTPVIDGWIDSLTARLDGQSHSIDIAGRSRVADLIDCTVAATPGSWRGKTLAAIAAEIVAPFGITASVAGDAGAAFASFAVQPGETAFEALDRLAKMRGLILTDSAAGALVFAAPKLRGDAVRIVEGLHPEALAMTHDVSQRFSDYTVTGQAAGDDERHGKAAAHVRAEAKDAGVARYRPLTIVAEDQATPASLKARAAREAGVRAAQAQTAEIVMPGWRGPNGAIWDLMQPIALVAPSLWIDATMMVTGVAFAIDEGGSRTTLSLGNEAAYAPEPVPDAAKASRIEKKGRTS